jgi:hypothetical protein
VKTAREEALAAIVIELPAGAGGSFHRETGASAPATRKGQ